MINKKKKKEAVQEIICFPEKYRVIGADFSLKRPGFCCITVEKRENYAVISDVRLASVDNKKNTKPHGELLNDILKGLVNFLPDEEKDGIFTFYVREKAFNSRAAMSEIGIFKVVGATEWIMWRLKKIWRELYPITVKKLITGDAKAEKNKVAECLKYYLGDQKYANDDESDAAAVAVAFLLQHGELQNRLEPVGEEKDNGDSDPSSEAD